MSRTPSETPTRATSATPTPVWLTLALTGAFGLLVPAWLLRSLLRRAKS